MAGTLERDLLLFELQRLNTRLEAAHTDVNERIDRLAAENKDDHQRVVDELSKINEDIAHLKVRSSVWGAVGGALAASVGAVAQFIGWPIGGHGA